MVNSHPFCRKGLDKISKVIIRLYFNRLNGLVFKKYIFEI